MPTTVTKVIGSGGNYSTLQAWEDACPANLVTADQIWRGECKNQDFSVGGGGIALDIAGTTTDATRYLELTTQAGASFVDDANVATNPLRFDSTKGASVTITGGYNNCITNSVDYTRISKLMVAATAASGIPIGTSNITTIDRCILEANGATTFGNSVTGAVTVTNTLHVQRASAATRITICGSTAMLLVNNTYVVPSDKTAATYGLDGSYGTVTVKNCAVFGATNTIETANSTFTCTTSRTDAGSPPSGFTSITYNTTTGSGFFNITDATRDFRLKSTSAMLDVGTTDATNAATDIRGLARPYGSAYDIGCWERSVATIGKTIGTAGDYSTLQAWEDAAPADLVAVDQIWEGRCKNQFFQQSLNSGTALLTVAGSTTSPTQYLHLTTDTGASFVDHASKATNPLRFDSSKGAAIDGNGSYSKAISGTYPIDFRISKLQVQNSQSGTSSIGITGSWNTVVLSQCIHEVNSASITSHLHLEAEVMATLKNSLVVCRASGINKLIEVFRHCELYNCTLAVPSDKTAATVGLSYSYSTDAIIKNCAFFGVAAVSGLNGGGAPAVTATTNKTDVGSPPAGWTTVAYDTTTGSGFENITDATRDFRIKASSALRDDGTTDSVNAPFDIIGYVRALWDIGAWEAEDQSVTSSPGAGAVAFAGAAPTTMIDVPVFGSTGQFDPMLDVRAWF